MLFRKQKNQFQAYFVLESQVIQEREICKHVLNWPENRPRVSRRLEIISGNLLIQPVERMGVAGNTRLESGRLRTPHVGALITTIWFLYAAKPNFADVKE